MAAALRRLGAWRRSTLLAVSGGADSLALLEAVARSGGGIGAVATVDHGARDVTAELALVEARAAAHGAPFHRLALQISSGPGFEARAREARYEALLGLKARLGFDLVLTGHTASDQAETVLARLSRGAGLGGASGIQAVRADGVARPLLFATRAETRAYLAALGLTAAEDPMNADDAFLRVRVREEALPALERAAGAGATAALARFAELAGEDEAYLSLAAGRALDRVALPGGGLDAVAVVALARPLGRRVVARWLQAAGFPVDAELIEDCLAAIAEGRQGTLPGDRVLTCRDGQVLIEAAPARLHTTSSVPGGHVSG